LLVIGCLLVAGLNQIMAVIIRPMLARRLQLALEFLP
jgi:hypothetical protein